MKIKLNSDESPLNKTIEIPGLTTVARAIFLKNNKYYLQLVSDECLENIKMESKEEL